MLIPLPSECRESKVKYPGPLGRKRRQRLLIPGLALGYLYLSLLVQKFLSGGLEGRERLFRSHP